MSLFKRKCNHEWKITEYSNVLQLDDMGYPLRLVICTCAKCGITEQHWHDVNKSALEQLDTGKSVLLKWQKI